MICFATNSGELVTQPNLNLNLKYQEANRLSHLMFFHVFLSIFFLSSFISSLFVFVVVFIWTLEMDSQAIDDVSEAPKMIFKHFAS